MDFPGNKNFKGKKSREIMNLDTNRCKLIFNLKMEDREFFNKFFIMF